MTEPWLRGVLPDLHPVTGHLLRASAQIREDIEFALRPLNSAQVWATPFGMTSAGFHAKHLAGSTRRLCTYLAGGQLSEEQLWAIPMENAGGESADQLLAEIEAAFQWYEALVRELDPADFGAVREVGRQRLRVTAAGLAIHIAEHGQRHVGQAISAAKLAVSA